MSAASNPTPPLRRTALNATHRALRAKMVDFGGWEMPVEYSGLIAEHMAVRTGAGLFDVSHMGDIQLRGPGSLAAVQHLCMNDASKLQAGQAQYSAMLTPDGTFVDDVVVHKLSDNDYLIVINAGTREKDVAWVRSQIGAMPSIHISDYSDFYTQLAIQGPKAEATLQKLTDTELSAIKNYWFTWGKVCGLPNVLIARTGYTGEDGFEISLAASEADAFARRLLRESEIEPIGLGARDSLRLEAGLCLYGHELDETIDPIEAGLAWSIQKRRRVEGGFPGAGRVQAALARGPARRRVGIRPEGRAPARDGADIVSASGEPIGRVTSGGFGPSVGAPIAMGYVASAYAAPGTPLALTVRGKALEARVAPLPFHPHAYYRG
jgi:aminomethyltransferase